MVALIRQARRETQRVTRLAYAARVASKPIPKPTREKVLAASLGMTCLRHRHFRQIATIQRRLDTKTTLSKVERNLLITKAYSLMDNHFPTDMDRAQVKVAARRLGCSPHGQVA